MAAKLKLVRLAGTLWVLICLQGATLAQDSSPSPASSGATTTQSESLGSYGSEDPLINSLPSFGKTTTTSVFQIQSSGGVPTIAATPTFGGQTMTAGLVSTAILPFLQQLFGLFRFICLAWLLILTIVIGMGFALQQYELKDLASAILGAFIVLGAQSIAGIFMFTSTTS